MANEITGASLSPIYQRLNDAPEYHPLGADTFSDWSLEAGDIVTVSREGKEYKSPVHSSRMVWKGGAPTVTLNATGNEKRSTIAKAAKKKFMRSGLRNSENAFKSIISSYNEMTAGLELASSSAALYVENRYKQMKAGLDLTSSSASLYVDSKYNQMKAGLDLTSSSAALYVENRYKQMKAGLDLTSSSASLYVDSKYNQMKAGLDLTSSSASLYVDNKYDQLKAGLDLTSSSASLYVDNKYDQLKAGLALTSSTAALYVQDTAAGLEGKIYVESGKTSMVTTLTDNRTVLSFPKFIYFPLTGDANYLYLDLDTKQFWEWNGSSYQQAAGPGAVINAASIVTSINEAGESEARIDANKVYIGDDKSTTIISGKLNTSELTTQKITTLLANAATVNVQRLNANTITFMPPGSSESVGVQTAIKEVQISGPTNNVYKLQYKTFYHTEWQDAGNFSRATSLSGTWSGTQYTVTASPQGDTDSVLISYRSNAYQNEYFFEGVYMKPGGSQWITIPQSSLDYKMALNGNSNGSSVILVRNDGSALPATWLTPRFPITITVPDLEIYTSDRVPSGSTNLSKLRNNFIQAQEDSDYVIFKVNASGVTRTFYMEP